MTKTCNHLASPHDISRDIKEPLTIKAAQDTEPAGADNAHHQGSNHHDHRVDNLGGVCGYLCSEVMFVNLNEEEGEQDEEFESLLQQGSHKCHAKCQVKIERVPG